MNDLTLALARMKLRPGGSKVAFESLETRLLFKLPAQYADFLMQSNGGEGAVGNAYLVLWSLEELEGLNQLYEVSRFAPGLFLIGSDGGDTGYGLDVRLDPPPVIEVPLIGLSLSTTKKIASTFHGFLEYLYKAN